MEVEHIRSMPCSYEKHGIISQRHDLFEALCTGPVKVQQDFDGYTLLLLRTCPDCGTAIGYAPTAEARQRLQESPQETLSRHAAGGAL